MGPPKNKLPGLSVLATRKHTLHLMAVAADSLETTAAGTAVSKKKNREVVAGKKTSTSAKVTVKKVKTFGSGTVRVSDIQLPTKSKKALKGLRKAIEKISLESTSKPKSAKMKPTDSKKSESSVRAGSLPSHKADKSASRIKGDHSLSPKKVKPTLIAGAVKSKKHTGSSDLLASSILTPALSVADNRKHPSQSAAKNKQSHLDDATSKDHYSQYGSIPSGFKYFKNVVRDLQPVAQKLQAASQKLTENSLFAHSIMERQEQMIADYVRRRGRVTKKDKLVVRRNLDKFSAELDRVHSEDNRTCRESYNYVDVKIQKMDADLRAKRSIYEELAKESRLEAPNEHSHATHKKGHHKRKKGSSSTKKIIAISQLLPGIVPAADADVKPSGVCVIELGNAAVGSSVAQPSNRLDPSMVKDMPIDPHEPLYCYCNQVSFGDMIACDNPECQTEWYHFACVGITRKPTGRWFCPTCRKLMQETDLGGGNGIVSK